MRYTRRPSVRPKPWRDKTWTSPATLPTDEPWAATEAWLRALVVAEAITAYVGEAGAWELILPDGSRVRVVADKDADQRLERAIL